MAASAGASEPKTQQLGWGLKLSSIPQPTTMQHREPAALLPGKGGRPSYPALWDAVFWCQVAIFNREYTTKSCSVTGDCCRAWKLCFSHLLACMGCAGFHHARDAHRKS